MWDSGVIDLPGDLYARLATAAELHSTTALKTCLQELRQVSLEGRQLSEHIRHLMRSYDMEGILRLISRATVPGSVAAEPVPTYGLAIAQQPFP